MGTCKASLPNQLILTSLVDTVFKLYELNWLRLIFWVGVKKQEVLIWTSASL